MAATWADIIKDHFWQQLRQQNARNRFIGRYKLLEIWRTTFQNQLEVEPHHEVRQIRDWLIDNHDDQSLLVLASVLVYIDWNDWLNFQKLFTDGHGKALFQLPLNEETASALLGTKGPNFCDSQPIFLPVTIIQGENLQFSEWDRLPFTEKECNTSAGVSATVKKIVIERSYFKDSNGETNQKQRVLARKRFHYPEDYETEITFLNEIRSNLRQHTHVLAHMSTLAIGSHDFSILSEFADRGDLQQFLVGPFSGYTTYRDRIIEEAAKIAHALDFLHKSFHVDGAHRPCYHMDLKPANILVFSHRSYEPQKRDDVGEWVITDFGVSAFHERCIEGASKTLPRREPGTYQPPEIDDRLGSPLVNAKGDIWSLGGILCMILAFLLAGSRGVEEHVRRRSWTAIGPQEQDFYYEITRHARAKAILKPRIHDWLLEIQDSSPDITWITGLIDLIQQCLIVDEHERPDAISVYTSLFRLQTRGEERLKSAPNLLQSSPLPAPAPAPIDYSQSSRLRKSFGRILHRRSHSTSQNVTQQPPLAIRPGSLASISPIDSTSTESSANSRFSSGSLDTLVQGRSAKHAAFDPCGQHIVLCFSQEALIFDLVPSLRQRQVPGTFDYINLAGHYLILYEECTSQPIFESLAMNTDRSFTKLTEASARFRTALKTAVSACGEVVLMQPRTLRAPKYLSAEFVMPKEFGNEKFRALSFDSTGTHLWACGSRHWFLWNVDSEDPAWLLQPETGTFAVQDWQAATPSIFTFNHRRAMCLYNDRTRCLRLFDASQDTNTQTTLETSLLCAIVGCRDHQIFYVRLAKSSQRPGLYMRPIQGAKIGTELTLTADLSGFDANAGFAIACRDEDPAQVLVVVSTQGIYQSHRFDLEDQDEPF